MIRSTLTAAALLAAGAISAAPLALSPGVILIPDEGIAYAADPRGYTQRIALDTGTPDWVSSEKVYPLAVADGWLIGIGAPDAPGSANVILLNPRSGEVEDRVSFDLPEAVTANVNAQPQRRFLASLLDTPEGVRVYWRHEHAELRGAAVMEPDADGNAAINPMTVLQGAIDLVHGGDSYIAVPIRGPVTEPVAPTVALAESERVNGLPGVQFRATDNAHVMVSSAQPDTRFGQLYNWSVYARDGARKGAYQSPYSYAPFTVIGDQLLIRDQPIDYTNTRGNRVQHGTRLVAIDLASGAERWSMEVLDSQYRGPLPP